MDVNGSVELVNAPDGFYLIIGRPGPGYELYRCHLTHVAHAGRKFELRRQALDEGEQ
jgi:hypothetical protein